MTSAFDHEIVMQEKKTWDALKESGSDLIPFLSKDCVMIFPGSHKIFTYGSSPSIKEILSREDLEPWSEYHMSDVHVLNLGKDAATISYRVHASRKGTEYQASVTSVWRKDDHNEWRLILHQQTPG